MEKRNAHRLAIGGAVGVCLLVDLLCSPSAHSAAPKLDLGVGIYGSTADSGPAQSRVAGTELSATFSHTMLDEISLNAEAILNLETGSSRALYSDEFKPKQGFRLKEGSATIRPTSYFRFSGGAIDQDRWKEPLLLSKQSFPSVLESIEFGEDYFFRLEAVQAFASDTSNLQPWNNFGNQSATFYMERVSFGRKWDEKSETSFQASHYLFDGLSPQLAYQSRFLGNSVNGFAASNSRFSAPFRGFSLGATTRFAVRPHLIPEVSLNYLVNPEAPRDRSQAWRAALAVAWAPRDTYTLTPTIEFFSVDSDVSPAIYNSRSRGHNNRSGYGLGLTADFKSPGLTVGAEWFDTKLIEAQTTAADMQWFQLSLRTRYDIL